MEQKYPTREQAERIALPVVACGTCEECGMVAWCDALDSSQAHEIGDQLLAMHVEFDRRQAEIDRLTALTNGMADWIETALLEADAWFCERMMRIEAEVLLEEFLGRR